MQFSQEDIKKLVNGVFRSAAESNQQYSDVEKRNSISKVENFANGLIANNFDIRNIENPITFSKVKGSKPYSPLKIGLALSHPKNADYLNEYLHLCRTYQFYIHPLLVSSLWIKTDNIRKKAELLSLSCPQTIEEMIKLNWINPTAVGSKMTNTQTGEELLLQFFLNLSNSDYLKSFYKIINQFTDLSQKRILIENLYPREKMTLPANCSIPDSASKKWNTEWIKIQLMIADSSTNSSAIAQISVWFKGNSNEQKLTDWSISCMKSCGISVEEEWIFLLISNTNTSTINLFPDSQKNEKFQNYLYPAYLHNALLYNNIGLFGQIMKEWSTEDFVKELEKWSSVKSGIILNWDFIGRAVSMIPISSEVYRWKIYRLLLNYFQSFLPDSFALELITVLKDKESKVLMSEEGIKTMSFLTGQLSLQANPIHLSKFENYLEQLIWHPLEKEINKLTTAWKFRLEMRKDFEREKRAIQSNEKK